MHWENLEGVGGKGGGRGIGMGNTCKPLAVSFQCVTKSTTNKKRKEKKEILHDLWNVIKELLYRHIMAVSEIKEKEKGKVYLRRKWLKLPKSWEEKWTKKLVKLK